jgi:WD40 repeat protein
LTFDSSGETLASAGDDNRVHVWNLKTKTQKLLDLHQSLVTCGKFSPDHTRFAACDFSGYLKVWDTKTWELLKTIQMTQLKLRSLAWSPDGRSIACVGGREVLNYEMSTGDIRKYVCDGAVHDIIFSKLGDEMIVSVQKNDNGSLLFFDYPGEKLTKELALQNDPTRLALSPDGKSIVTGYYNGGIGVISAVTRTILKQVVTEATYGAVWTLGFTTDGKNLIASGGDNRLILYETETWEPLCTIMDHKSRVHAMAFSADGRKIATGDMSGKIVIRDIPN